MPSVKPREAVRFLLRFGFVKVRQRGSHAVFVNNKTNKQTIVPIHNRDLTIGVLKTIAASAGLSVEEMIERL